MLTDVEIYRLASYIVMDSRLNFQIKSVNGGYIPANYMEVTSIFEKRINFMLGKFTVERMDNGSR